MTEIRLEAKTFVITDEGHWVKVWDAREPLTLDELDKVAGGIPFVNMIAPPDQICPPLINM